MKKRTKASVIVAIFLCVSVIATTFALYSKFTSTIDNTFTKSAGVTISLREPAWDGYTFDDSVDGVALGTQKNPAKDAQFLGIDAANAYMPLDEIKKDPTLKLEEGSDDAWVAIKVEFFDNEGNPISEDGFRTNYGTMQMNSKFELIDRKSTYSIYMYQSTLSEGEVTEALFNSVIVNENIAFVDGMLPSFQVKTKGYALQAKNIDKTKAAQELIDMGK